MVWGRNIWVIIIPFLIFGVDFGRSKNQARFFSEKITSDVCMVHMVGSSGDSRKQCLGLHRFSSIKIFLYRDSGSQPPLHLCVLSIYETQHDHDAICLQF